MDYPQLDSIRRPRLLVSVRSAAEAEAALQGGADLIDVKEPANGSLGAASVEVIRVVVETVAGRKPVSAALGELVDGRKPPPVPGLAFLKWGLSGLGPEEAWEQHLPHHFDLIEPPTQGVVVFYADCFAAMSPVLPPLVEFARARDCVVLVDTFVKEGRTLLDLMPESTLDLVFQRCRKAGVRLALAGSLGIPEVERILQCGSPQWIAVRGAVCERGHREQTISADRVRQLAERLRQATPES